MRTGEHRNNSTTVTIILMYLPLAFKNIIYVLLFAGLLSRSHANRVSLFIAILILGLCTFHFAAKRKETGDIPQTIYLLLAASDALLLNDVTELRLVEQQTDTNKLGFWERVKWALKWMTSPRQIGWTHEPRHVLPPHPTESRWKFVRSRLLHCLGYFAAADLAATFMLYSPVFKGEHTSIADGDLVMRVFYTGLMAILTWAYLSLMYDSLAIVAVATRLTNINNWPKLFGRWSDAYTVRRFWGRTWHQNLRRTLTVHADFVTYKLLCLRKDTFFSTNVHRHVAFTISGLIHAFGEHGTEYWAYDNTMKFFLLQATAIMIEQEVSRVVGLKAGTWTRRVGYVWTFFWFVWTYPAWASPQVRYAFKAVFVFWRRDGEVGSVTNYLWKGEWKIGDF